ncbi:hypothetical protein D3C78_1913060 [compost metagenome]
MLRLENTSSPVSTVLIWLSAPPKMIKRPNGASAVIATGNTSPPTISMTMSTPRPSVSSRTCSTQPGAV